MPLFDKKNPRELSPGFAYVFEMMLGRKRVGTCTTELAREGGVIKLREKYYLVLRVDRQAGRVFVSGPFAKDELEIEREKRRGFSR